MKRYKLDFSHRPAYRLVRVVEILTQLQVIDPIPNRRTIIRWIESGKIEGKRTNVGYIVYEDSLKAWIKSLLPDSFSEIK